jgi:DNA-binding transcriptional ArsR family regulator
MASDLLSAICAEIDMRMKELRPSLAEYERLLTAADALVTNGGQPVGRVASRPARARQATRGSAAGAIERAAGTPPRLGKPKPKVKPGRAQRGAAREAILAALGHGSHTVGELVVVTAMSAPSVNGNLRRMTSEGIVVKTEREGKTAYALAEAG